MSLVENTDTSIKLLTLREAASILKISKRTLHRMIQTGQIPGLKVGGQWRILESRLEELVQEETDTAPNAGVIGCPKVVD
jgi:excisionase family DNA binding protein